MELTHIIVQVNCTHVHSHTLTIHVAKDRYVVIYRLHCPGSLNLLGSIKLFQWWCPPVRYYYYYLPSMGLIIQSVQNMENSMPCKRLPSEKDKISKDDKDKTAQMQHIRHIR